MADEPSRRDRLAAYIHGFLEHLTAVKIRVGALRLLVRRGAIAPAEVEERLVQIEHDIEEAATQADDVRVEAAKSIGVGPDVRA
jgi:hypothetical protein